MTSIDYKELKPNLLLSDFVESFWMLSNTSDEEKQIVLVPDGRIDLSFSFQKPYGLTLLGLESEPARAILEPKTNLFSVSFKLLAIEYLFDRKFPTLVNAAYQLPTDYLGITAKGFTNFESFCNALSEKLLSKLTTTVDERKKNLFDLVYRSNGAISVQEISETLHWSSRQINRYFNDWFGISLKAYCDILRFRASFQQIKEGRLFPEGNFTDQAHFIKHVKKFSGVTPKELNKNTNDRFIQFSTLKKR
jgi:AraC-like DNA-binding protein